jgi:hypothetical protein
MGAGTQATFVEKLMDMVTGFQAQWAKEQSTVDLNDYILTKMKEVGEGKYFTKNKKGENVLELLLYTPKNNAHREQLLEENETPDIRQALTFTKEEIQFLTRSLDENKAPLSRLISNYRDVDYAYWSEEGRVLEQIGKHDYDRGINLGPLGIAPKITQDYMNAMAGPSKDRNDFARKATVEFECDMALRSLSGNEKQFFTALKEIILSDNKVTENEQDIANYIGIRVKNDDMNIAFDKDHITETIGELKAIIKNNANIDASILDQAAKKIR